MPRRRLGVALLLEDDLAVAVDALREAVGDSQLALIPPHCTITPPINVRTDDLAEVLRLVRDGAAMVAPLSLEIGPVSTFWPVTPVLKLDVTGDVDGLQVLREHIFAGPLHREYEYEYVPHVTLAVGLEPDRLAAAVQAMPSFLRTWSVDTVTLLQEDRDHVWRPLAAARLGMGRIVGFGDEDVAALLPLI